MQVFLYPYLSTGLHETHYINQVYRIIAFLMCHAIQYLSLTIVCYKDLKVFHLLCLHILLVFLINNFILISALV